MPDFEDTMSVDRGGMRCANCGEDILPADDRCAACGYDLPPAAKSPATLLLRRKPNAVAKPRAESDYFGPNIMLILQVLPSGTCLSTTLAKPMVLGRQNPGDNRAFCDLTEFHANQHGVSRQHCELRRYGDQLVVTDLDSSNGTYLNGYTLVPGEDHVVADGDKLIIGTLHLVVTFNAN